MIFDGSFESAGPLKKSLRKIDYEVPVSNFIVPKLLMISYPDSYAPPQVTLVTQTPAKLNQILLLSILVLISWTLISPCYAAENGNTFTEIINGGEKTTNTWQNMWSGFQNGNSTTASTQPLAANRTRRIDPSDYYNYYEGGWDITNSHYILSLLYSGAPLFATAVIWCFCAGLGIFIFYLCYCCCCCKNKREQKYSRKAHTISLTFLVIFLIMAVAGGAFFYYGQVNFQSTVTDVLAHVVRKANEVIDVANDAFTNLASAAKMGIANYSLPEDFKQNIEQLNKLFNYTAILPKFQAEGTTRSADLVLDVVRHWFLGVSAVLLVLVVVGFIMSFCGWKLAVYIAIGDTCVAMEDWVRRPHNGTALSKLLPCMDEETAQKNLVITRNTSFGMVNWINAFILDVANADVTPNRQALYYNQSGPLMPFLCNPFSPNLTERTCANNEVQLNSAPQAYKGFVCPTSPSGICTSIGRMTPDHYTQIMVATKASDTLAQEGQFLVELADCSFVAETFDEIIKQHCPLLRRYGEDVNIGLLLLAVALMCSIILWASTLLCQSKLSLVVGIPFSALVPPRSLIQLPHRVRLFSPPPSGDSPLSCDSLFRHRPLCETLSSSTTTIESLHRPLASTRFSLEGYDN
ncbi:hypothetical protein L6164_021645 [Bauhinia variegata]|uniref:Uncharacterized protein n=1 Tax=Bauhinia variegata TaxID=167791 RepID=A0ACB9MZH5_BAUVA|nr:hypothetical protein L6164_021645 [Bauhinia variegata]